MQGATLITRRTLGFSVLHKDCLNLPTSPPQLTHGHPPCNKESPDAQAWLRSTLKDSLKWLWPSMTWRGSIVAVSYLIFLHRNLSCLSSLSFSPMSLSFCTFVLLELCVSKVQLLPYQPTRCFIYCPVQLSSSLSSLHSASEGRCRPPPEPVKGSLSSPLSHSACWGGSCWLFSITSDDFGLIWRHI